MFSVDEELQEYAPETIIVPRAIDLSDWPYVGPINTKKPLVVHAPSRRNVKGTEYILKAVQELRQQGVEFDFKLVEDMPHSQARQLYEASDIIIDQLRIGTYGVLAVEGMALGKTVLSYVYPENQKAYGTPSPMIYATPDTILKCLKEAVLNPSLRQEKGRIARAFVEKHHCSSRVAKTLLGIYSQPGNAVNMDAYIQTLQADLTGRHIDRSTFDKARFLYKKSGLKVVLKHARHRMVKNALRSNILPSFKRRTK